MNEHTPQGPRHVMPKSPRPPKKPVNRRRLLVVAACAAAALALAVTGVIIWWKSTVRPIDIDRPSAAEPDSGPSEPEQGRDYYEGDLVKPFVEDENKTRKEDYYTFLLCGTDEDSARTDTIIVASYDVKNQTINMVNVPRDTMSNVRRSIKKINSAFYGGVEQLREELQMLLGFRIDRTVVVDFQGFVDLINAIGGVEFDVPVRMLYTDPTQDLYIDLVPGLQTLDGDQALQLIRFRQNNPGVPGGYPGGDIERIACQQEFLQAVASQLLSPTNLLKVSDIASAVLNNTETDMSMGELMWLGIQALSMKAENISMSILPGTARYLWEADYGHMQSYYVPEEAGILELVNEKLNPYNEPITDLNLIDASAYPTSPPAEDTGDGGDVEPPAEETPSDPDASTEPSGQDDPTEPSDPSEQTDPTEPSDPSEQTDPAEPSGPEQPENLSDSQDDDPVQPGTPADPPEPAGPAEPGVQPEDPASGTTVPEAPAGPVQPQEETPSGTAGQTAPSEENPPQATADVPDSPAQPAL